MIFLYHSLSSRNSYLGVVIFQILV